MNSIEVWLRGLVAALIGGGSGAVSSMISLTVIDPKDFSTAHPLQLLQAAGIAFVVGALISVSAYLSKSPIPDTKTITTTTQEVKGTPNGAVVTTVKEVSTSSSVPHNLVELAPGPSGSNAEDK